MNFYDFSKQNKNNDYLWDRIEQKEWNVPNGFLEALDREKNNIKDLFSITTFIETGTCNGTTSEIMSFVFDKVFTVEKYPTNELKEKYKNISSKHNNIKFLTGNSPEQLEIISKEINNERCVILLDAHNGHDTPIINELQIIKKLYNKNSVIIIDDTCDCGTGNWPTSKEQLKNILRDINPECTIKDTGLGRDIIISY